MRCGFLSLAIIAMAVQAQAQDLSFFEQKIRPVLVESCYRCHSAGAEKIEAGLRLDTREGMQRGGQSGQSAVVPGQPEKSRLVEAIRDARHEQQMSPKERLSDRQVQDFVAWIKLGALDPRGEPVRSAKFQARNSEHWAFKPVRGLSPPAVKNGSRIQTPIDHFILAKLEPKGLSLATPADRRTLLRRATYDLLGLPPTPEELDAFLRDASPDAFAKVLDRLLDSPAYGERWGRNWLDVVRYADARDLIQLPVESDFREAWRYRDWVVEAHNRDLPYTEFIRRQIAGDLLQPSDPHQIDQDSLVATGLLALADFVPGDVDKDLMIADYVNDQIDVVGRAFLGLTLGCARCHDHKFDPVTIEDYYSLAGIFFSTRLIPSPVLGNTPLVRVPLLPKAEIERIAANKKQVGVLEKQLQQLKIDADLEYMVQLEQLATEQTARYLLATWEFKNRRAGAPEISLIDFAKKNHLHPTVLTQWVDYLGQRGTRGIAPPAGEPPQMKEAWTSWLRILDSPAEKSPDHSSAERAALEMQSALAAVRRERAAEINSAFDNGKPRLPAEILKLRAGDTGSLTSSDRRVTFWPNRARSAARFATVAPEASGPLKTNTTIGGRSRSVLRFSGKELLEVPQTVPPSGSLFLVFRVADKGTSGERLIGWEDSNSGRHGLGLMTTPGGGLHAILRKDGGNGDIVAPPQTNAVFDIVSLTWGAHGTTMHRQGVAVGKSAAIDGLSSDPKILALRIGGPGSGDSGKFRGDLAELRVYSQPLDDAARAMVEKELSDSWQNPDAPEATPPSPLSLVYDELCSPRSPFWLDQGNRDGLVASELAPRIGRTRADLEALKKSIPTNIPQAVVVQDGGPATTKHEGFKDAHVYLRGNHKTPGKIVPRGFPKFLAGESQPVITEGSGRLRLADWIASRSNPLTARVAVNRIWQHHFGDGIVRTSANFGERGERPTHPELLDYLAIRFIESGWSMKAMHRLMMLSAVYQQSSRASPEVLASDPENVLLGRMNRTRLDAESLRDSLLFVAGRLDRSRGGMGFQEVSLPRRSIYLMSVRTGSKSGFASVFDSPDSGAVVEKRSVSTVAPQALFLLNDPFSSELAGALGKRVARESPASATEDQIRAAYRLVFGRPPTGEEVAIGRELLQGEGEAERLDRYCQILLCANEFVYVD